MLLAVHFFPGIVCSPCCNLISSQIAIQIVLSCMPRVSNAQHGDMKSKLGKHLNLFQKPIILRHRPFKTDLGANPNEMYVCKYKYMCVDYIYHTYAYIHTNVYIYIYIMYSWNWHSPPEQVHSKKTEGIVLQPLFFRGDLQSFSERNLQICKCHVTHGNKSNAQMLSIEREWTWGNSIAVFVCEQE